MSTRRKFLQSALVSSAAVLTGEQLVAGTDKDRRTLINQPIVISTWDFGKAANAEAWKILTNGGRRWMQWKLV
jgi:N4-(beta-N-acetylglucosaminyl)-L-asparaginase